MRIVISGDTDNWPEQKFGAGISGPCTIEGRQYETCRDQSLGKFTSMIRYSLLIAVFISVLAATASLVIVDAGINVAAAQQAQQAQQPRQQILPGPRIKTLQRIQRQQEAARKGPPPPEVIATHGKWQVQCSPAPQPPAPPAAAAEGQSQGGSAGKSDAGVPPAGAPPSVAKQCGMMQVTQHEKNKNIALTLILGRTQQNDKEVIMMRVLAPVGVYLPLGIAMEVDSAPIGRMTFIRCLPQFCMAEGAVVPDTLEKMRKGNGAKFIIYEAPGAGATLPVSLEGFTKALDVLRSL